MARWRAFCDSRFDAACGLSGCDAKRGPGKSTRTQRSCAAANERLRCSWLRSMPLADRIAQLIVITSYGEAPSSRSAAFRDFVHAVRDLKVGGMIVVNRVVSGSVRNAEPYAMAAFLNRMQRLAKYLCWWEPILSAAPRCVSLARRNIRI